MAAHTFRGILDHHCDLLTLHAMRANGAGEVVRACLWAYSAELTLQKEARGQDGKTRQTLRLEMVTACSNCPTDTNFRD